MKPITIFLFTIFTHPLFSQNSEFQDKDKLTKTLIGVWEFEKMIDKDDKEVKEITKEVKGSPFGDEIKIGATGPKMTLFSNGKYELEFKTKKIDNGNWFLESSNILVLQLITKKGSSSYNLLKSAAEMYEKKLNYDSNGNIVENITHNISIVDENKMLVNYETSYFQVYKKKK